MSKAKQNNITSLNLAFVNLPKVRGFIKLTPEDFIVTEKLGFRPSGTGEHVWLYIEKRGMNTMGMVAAIASTLGISGKLISYSGLKDKQALTRQWLSIRSVVDIDPEQINIPHCRLLKLMRHKNKLQRGTHKANLFEITIRSIDHQTELEQSIQRVKNEGVPNYFGPQRFGHRGKNIQGALAMFKGEIQAQRFERGLYLSAARAFLFNEILSERVKQADWNKVKPGEVMVLAGSNSFLKASVIDDELQQRMDIFDIHPSAPLWGKGQLASSLEVGNLENRIINKHVILSRGLEDFGLRQQRRATRLCVEDFEHQWLSDDTLKLSFGLISGAFATTVLRELLTIGTE